MRGLESLKSVAAMARPIEELPLNKQSSMQVTTGRKVAIINRSPGMM